MKHLFFVIALSLHFTVYCQNNYGLDPTLLINKDLKVLPKKDLISVSVLEDFYKNENMRQHYKSYENLEEQTFKIMSVERVKGSYAGKYVMKLHNDKTGDVYYLYSSNGIQFPFEVVGGYPEGYFCKAVVKKEDKFTGETTIMNPPVDGIMFFKIMKKDSVNYYMRIETGDEALTKNRKGVILLLENDMRIDKPELDVNVEVKSGLSGAYYLYGADVPLTDNDIRLLTENAITDIRLDIHDRSIYDGNQLKEYAKCVLK
ncbi:MAG: hypothetical protein ACTHJ5_13695 [Ilyomonas sp.]